MDLTTKGCEERAKSSPRGPILSLHAPLPQPSFPGAQRTRTSCCSGGNLRKEIRCGAETSPLGSPALPPRRQEERALRHRQQPPRRRGTPSQAGRKCSLKIPYLFASLLRIKEIKDRPKSLPFYHRGTLTLWVIFLLLCPA